MVPDLAPELQAAEAAARAAAELVQAVYAREVAVQWKTPGDPVTEADQAANALLVERLHRQFPDDAICAEESPGEQAQRAASRGGRCWFVDPLDGTREFLRKSGEFCVMVGLSVAGRPVLGVVVAPAWGRMFCGVVGQGAWEVTAAGTRRPLQVGASRPATAAAARVVLSRLHRNPEVDAATERLGIRDIRQCGSTGLKFMLVAAGEVDLFMHTGAGPKLWDGCAPEALALGAGLCCSDEDGALLQYGPETLELRRGIVVAPPGLHGRLLAAIDGT